MTSINDLEGLKYTEYINIKNGLKILQNWDDVIKSLPEKRQKKILEKIHDFDPLLNLKKICKEKKDIIHTNYSFSKTLKTCGRLFANNSSLQKLPREFRNALADGLYYDIDMKNAHPNLLSQYCEKNGIRCKILDMYISNRDNILTEISKTSNISLQEAKDLFLKLLNGGNNKIENITMSNDYIHDFKNEMKNIHKQICLINSDDFKKCKLRKDFNPEGTMINILLCKLEHKMLMNAVYFLKNKGFNVDVLVFDGFMVRKEEGKIITEKILDELNLYIKEQTGYNIKFVEKSLENTIDLSKYIEPLYDTPEPITYFKDKEEFEKTHLKIIHPLMYLTLLEDGSIDYQTEDKIKGSYKHKKNNPR